MFLEQRAQDQTEKMEDLNTISRFGFLDKTDVRIAFILVENREVGVAVLTSNFLSREIILHIF